MCGLFDSTYAHLKLIGFIACKKYFLQPMSRRAKVLAGCPKAALVLLLAKP